MLYKFFVPQPNITAYELAVIVSRVSGLGAPYRGITFKQADWDELPDNIKAHFSDVRPTNRFAK